ncbi:hypothetical protein RDI58_023219 [Solanum bulbocastanum]|uniref:SET domain-containing protein n=1 Tax=Solanum bulbocastanum TaxID=147425 RepID=A0AAN8T5I8_SOLBU
MENNQLLKISEIEGRGRGIVATQPLKPGQIILKDSPLFLYPASVKNSTFCSNCFRVILQSPIPCSWCTSSFFCTSNCQSIALSSSHTPWVCQSLTHLRNTFSSHNNLNVDQQIQAFFLISAYNLAVISPSSFRVLLSLQGDLSFVSESDALLLHSLVATCPSLNLGEFGFFKELTAALLAKDKVNAFGLMEPFEVDRERGVRAYGIYPMASFFNHDCLPNACRFEYVDTDVNSRSNTDIVVRVIHDVPEGREICLSYFPVNFKYSERQQRLKEDYGFTCNCDRCVVEANWSDGEDDAMDKEGEENEEEEEEDEEMEEDVDDEVNVNGEVEERDQDFPHAYFFLRYMCNRENCWGTLAPLPPDASPSSVMECNICGNMSKSDEL